ncbi:hypothetical protein Ancab_020302 [Ancistrocladus abbreviatus]
METVGTRYIVKKDQAEKLSAPPGFVSLTTFTLKRCESNKKAGNLADVRTAFEQEESSMQTSSDLDDTEMIKRNLKVMQRPWIIDHTINDKEESVSEEPDMDLAPDTNLPKGVIRGCPECSNCQKVIARWDPEGACTIKLKEAPVFHPGEEEFSDPIKYIESIRQQVEPYGFCRIVPPPSWQPPCPLEESYLWETKKFATKVQRINELQGQHFKRKTCPADEPKRSKKTRILRPGSEHVLDNGYTTDFDAAQSHRMESFEFVSGPQFTLEAFENYADYFRKHYFSPKCEVKDTEFSPNMSEEHVKLSEEHIEGEYWRIVEKPTEEIEVLCGYNLDARSFQSGFPVPSKNAEKTSASMECLESGWNLNNTSMLPASLLSFERSDSSGVLHPWLHIGMCFSSLPWVMQLTPATISSEGIPVYRCVQNSREFVLFLPRVYHSGFDSGFSCSESADFAPLDWLPHGQNVVELYREKGRKTSLSHDKLLLRAANEAVKAQFEFLVKGKRKLKNLTWKEACVKDGILVKSLVLRIKKEARLREYLSTASQSKKVDKSFDAVAKRECITCNSDLFLSAATCLCNPNRYSCLYHTRRLCHCPWSEKIFLFRYEINELNILAEALEGKFSAIHMWLKGDLGLALELNPSNGRLHIPVEHSTCLSETLGEENHEAKDTPIPRDDGKATTSLTGTMGEKKHDAIHASTPSGNGEVNAIKEVLSEEKACNLQEATSSELKGTGVDSVWISSSSDLSEDSRSSSSLELDEEASFLGFQFGKNGSSAPKREMVGSRTSKETNSEHDIMESSEVSSKLATGSNLACEKQSKVKSPSHVGNIISLSDDEDGGC